ncbi:MAG: hypothetical protein EBY20_01785 [Alphaproteobacteria bacterium]|nr:hypothetical protein [Alphaproteobacteria bacterium]
MHIQNARFAGSYEWHGTVTLRILNAQRCKRPLIEPLLETIDKDNYKDKKRFFNYFRVYGCIFLKDCHENIKNK